MKRVRIDFAPPGLARTIHRTGPAAWGLAALALALCAAAAVIGSQMHVRQRALDAQLALVRTHVAPRIAAPVQPRAPIPAPQAAAVNAAVLQLNTPWQGLRDAIGAATPPAIALLTVEPDPRRRSIRITAEAKTSDDMIAYVEQLKAQEMFGTVALVRHEISELDPNRPIRFQLDAQWSAP